MFTEARINNYLMNADKEEIKHDEEYDIFRELVNENVKLNEDNPSYIERSKVSLKISKFKLNHNLQYKNESIKFTWFKDPQNFKIDEDDEEDEEKEENNSMMPNLHIDNSRR